MCTHRRVICILLLCIPFILAVETVAGQRAFSYQGFLEDGGNPAEGSFDVQFSLYDASSGGSQIGSTLSKTVSVSEGVFEANLDFGTAFDGAARWLEIAVRPASSSDSYEVLNPRTRLNPSPYAMGLAPPVATRIATGTEVPLLTLTQTGDGTAARFEMDNPTATLAPVFIKSNGTGMGLLVHNVGAGTGVHAMSTNNHAVFAEGTAEVQTADLGVTSSHRYMNEDFTVEANDAYAGFYSNGAGSWGSGIDLGQVDGGALTDKWSIVRETGLPSALNFIHGTDPNFTSNTRFLRLTSNGNLALPEGNLTIGAFGTAGNLYVKANSSLSWPHLRLSEEQAGDFARISMGNTSNASQWHLAAGGTDNDRLNIFRSGSGDLVTVRGTGRVGIGTTNPEEQLHVNGVARADELVYNTPRTHYASISGKMFRPQRLGSSVTFISGGATTFGAYFTAGFVNSMQAPVQIPHGATVDSFTCALHDNDDPIDLKCALLRSTPFGDEETMAEVQTEGIAQTAELTDDFVDNEVITNDTHAYYVRVTAIGDDWAESGSLVRAAHARIQYTLTAAQ